VLVPHGSYKIVLNSDNPEFGGNGLVNEEQVFYTCKDTMCKKEKKEWLRMYLPARTALVLKKNR
jgi:1,4-alpha-glucan branching enzyme